MWSAEIEIVVMYVFAFLSYYFLTFTLFVMSFLIEILIYYEMR